MELFPGHGSHPEMFVVKLDIPQQVMIEKWLLVLLIVGCTSLVFLICFPIDFYLYRRRKRIARERKNLTMYRPQTPTRAAQIHAKVTKVAAEINIEEMNEEEERRDRAEKRIKKYLNMFKKKSQSSQKENLKFQSPLAGVNSEKNTNLQATSTLETNEVTKAMDEQASGFHSVVNAGNINNSPRGVNETAENLNKGNKILRFQDGNPKYISERKFSNVSMTWSENEDLFRYESRHLRYGAHEPLENLTHMTSMKGKTKDLQCYAIRIKSENLVYVEPGNHIADSNVDFDVQETSLCQSDLTERNKTKISPNIDQDHQQFASKQENISKLIHLDTDTQDTEKKTQMFQTVFNTGADRNVKRYKILTHSQSDQCISEKLNFSKSSLKNGKKRNMISPTDQNTFTFLEPPYNDENFITKDTTIHFHSPLVENSATPKAKRKKRKRQSLLKKKQSSNSMPELIYENEKY